MVGSDYHAVERFFLQCRPFPLHACWQIGCSNRQIHTDQGCRFLSKSIAGEYLQCLRNNYSLNKLKKTQCLWNGSAKHQVVFKVRWYRRCYRTLKNIVQGLVKIIDIFICYKWMFLWYIFNYCSRCTSDLEHVYWTMLETKIIYVYWFLYYQCITYFNWLQIYKQRDVKQGYVSYVY